MNKFLHFSDQSIAIDRIVRYEKAYSKSIRFFILHESPVEVEFNSERGRNRAWNELKKQLSPTLQLGRKFRVK